MGLEYAIFAVKLCELEREYGRLQSRIRLCRDKNGLRLQRELEELQEEYRGQKLLLEESVKASRSASAASLAAAQLEYSQRVERILRHELPEEMKGRTQSARTDQAEAMSLYAEYAIDFATQSMRQAMIAALSAMLLQRQAEREERQAQKEGELR